MHTFTPTLKKQGLDKTADCAIAAQAVTTNVDLPRPSRGLYIGGAGNAAVIMSDGSEVTFTGLLAGVFYPFSVTRVKTTGTTATNIIATF